MTGAEQPAEDYTVWWWTWTNNVVPTRPLIEEVRRG